MAHPVPKAFAERPALLLHKLGQVIVVRAAPELARIGITGRQYVVLALLGADEPASQADLAELCDLGPAQIVAVVDELERAGLAERRRDERDRRRSVVRLTADGRRVLERADAVGRALEDTVLGDLDDALRERVLAAVRDGLGALYSA